MATVLPNGDSAGAPLGVYRGLDLGIDRPDFSFTQIGGSVTAFSAHELLRRYPSRDVYVDLVEKAAAHLLEHRYILEEDYNVHVRTARSVWCTKIAASPLKNCNRQEAAR